MVDAGAVADPIAPRRRHSVMGRRKIKYIPAVTSTAAISASKTVITIILKPLFFKRAQLEKTSHAERYEGKRDVRHETHAVYYADRHKIKRVRSYYYPCKNVSGNVGQFQKPRYSRQKESRKQNYRQTQYDYRARSHVSVQSVKHFSSPANKICLIIDVLCDIIKLYIFAAP